MDKIVIEPVNTVKDINKHSFISYTPFTAVGDLVYVQTEWWYNLTRRQRESIATDFGDYYGYCVRDKIKKSDTDNDNEAFWKFYNGYISSYATSQWAYCLKSPYCSTGFDSSTIAGLLKLAQKCKHRYFEVMESDLDFYTPIYRHAIEKYFQKHSSGIFFKISDKSGKYRGEIKPKFSLVDIVNEIIHNSDLVDTLKRFGTKSSLLLRPWNYEIGIENEFRVIVNNRKITGISQQQCYKYVNLTEQKMRIYVNSIVKRFNELKHKFPYNSCVMDMWIDGNKTAHIIEMNPGELWSTSGSGLFHWINDYDKLYNSDCIYARYIDMNSPLIKGNMLTGGSTGSIGMCPSITL